MTLTQTQTLTQTLIPTLTLTLTNARPGVRRDETERAAWPHTERRAGRRSAWLGTCNPKCWRLQPYAAEAATLSAGGCSPTRQRLQP